MKPDRPPLILIYNDASDLGERAGVSQLSFTALAAAIRREVGARADVRPVTPRKLRDPLGPLAKSDVALLCFPGGRDIPFCQQLDGPGVFNIRRYVADGGGYLGVCAGAYFASASIRFAGKNNARPYPGEQLDADTTMPPIEGARELALVPAHAVGGLELGCADPFDEQPLGEADVVRVTATGTDGPAHALYWLGPAFCPLPDDAGTAALNTDRFEVLARYDDADNSAAAVCAPFEAGRAVLSGVHCEIRWDDFEDARPGFSSAAASPDPLRVARIARLLREHEDTRRAMFRMLLERAIAPRHADLLAEP